MGSGNTLMMWGQVTPAMVAKLRGQVYHVLTALLELATETGSGLVAGRDCNAAAAATPYLSTNKDEENIDASEVITSKVIIDAGIEKSTVA